MDLLCRPPEEPISESRWPMMGPGGEKLPGEHQLSSRTEYGTTTYTVFVLETIPWQPLIPILDLYENGLDVYTDLFGGTTHLFPP